MNFQEIIIVEMRDYTRINLSISWCGVLKNNQKDDPAVQQQIIDIINKYTTCCESKRLHIEISNIKTKALADIAKMTEVAKTVALSLVVK